MKKTILAVAALVVGLSQGAAVASGCSTTSASGWHWAGVSAATQVAKDSLPAGYNYVSGSARCSQTAPGAPATCTVRGQNCPVLTTVSRQGSARQSGSAACSDAANKLTSSYPSVQNVRYTGTYYNGNVGYFHCTAQGQVQ